MKSKTVKSAQAKSTAKSRAAKSRTKPKAAKKGKLIVIDGVDGSGKATQTSKVVAALRKLGLKVKTIDFPQYKKNHFGRLIKECQNGEHGDFTAMSPRIAASLYAADRFESSAQIKQWLDEGHIVIADRYVSANQIHQGGKCKTDAERQSFLKWLDHMEHGKFKIPRPDIIFYLNLPLEVSQALIEQRKKSATAADKKKMKLQQGKRDLTEEDLEYQEASRQSAFKIIKSTNNWVMIDCYDGGLLPKDVVHGKIMHHVHKLIR